RLPRSGGAGVSFPQRTIRSFCSGRSQTSRHHFAKTRQPIDGKTESYSIRSIREASRIPRLVRRNTPSQFSPARAGSYRREHRIISGRRLETEAIVAEILLQLLDPPPNEGSGFARTGNIDRLAVATESKDRVACVRAHVAEHPLHHCEVPVRRETDRLRPRGKIAQQLARVARIDGNHRRPGIRRVHVHLENFA